MKSIQDLLNDEPNVNSVFKTEKKEYRNLYNSFIVEVTKRTDTEVFFKLLSHDEGSESFDELIGEETSLSKDDFRKYYTSVI